MYDPEGVSVTMAAQSGGWGGKTGLYAVGYNRREGITGELEAARALMACDTRGINRNQTQNAVFVDLCSGDPKLTDTARCIKAKYNSGITNRAADNSGVLVGCKAVLSPDRFNRRQHGRRFKECGEPSFTLTAQDKHGVCLSDCSACSRTMKLKQATEQGYAEAACGDSINLMFPDSKTRRGRVGKSVAKTLETSCNQGVPFVGCGRIRRLTPRECWRLQGFSDEMFDRARAVNSDNQLYRQAGNSVTINVVYAIGQQIAAVQEAYETGQIKEV